MKKIILCLISVLATLTLQAQMFIVDPVLDDSVWCQRAVLKDSTWARAEGSIMLAKGTLIDACGKALNEGDLVFKNEQGTYLIRKSELKFNEAGVPEGTVNPLSEDIQRKHSSVAYFYYSLTPAFIVVVLMLLVLLLGYLPKFLNNEMTMKIAQVGIPSCILLVAVIEIVGYKLLGTDIFWWCDYDRYGFFGSLFRLLPFVFVVAIQLLSYRLYKDLLPTTGVNDGVSIKPTIVGMALCVPVLVVFAIVSSLWLPKSIFVDLLGIALFFGTLACGIFVSLKRNIEALGKMGGILFTAFCVIYVLSCFIAIIGMLVVVLKLIFQVLMVVAAIVLFSVLSKRTYYKGSDGHTYADSGFENMHRVD